MVTVPTKLKPNGMPVVDFTDTKVEFVIKDPMVKLDDEVSRVTLDISYGDLKTTMELDILFCKPDGTPLPNDHKFAYAREYAEKLLEALANSINPEFVASLD